VEVVAAPAAGLRVALDAAGREDPLPGPLAVGVGVLLAEGVGEADAAGPVREVGLVLCSDALDVLPELLPESAPTPTQKGLDKSIFYT